MVTRLVKTLRVWKVRYGPLPLSFRSGQCDALLAN